jgi:hypothetical protein
MIFKFLQVSEIGYEYFRSRQASSRTETTGTEGCRGQLCNYLRFTPFSFLPKRFGILLLKKWKFFALHCSRVSASSLPTIPMVAGWDPRSLPFLQRRSVRRESWKTVWTTCRQRNRSFSGTTSPRSRERGRSSVRRSPSCGAGCRPYCGWCLVPS